jgi:large subunit ribosomal protein L25
MIPCVVYGPDIKPMSFSINQHELEMVIRRHSGENIIMNLSVGGEVIENVLIKSLQRDPVTDHALHADFMKISMTRKLRIMVATRLVGDPVGVTQNGGILEHQARTVEVECLPMDIIKEFVLDVSALDIDGRLFVRDIPPDPKLTILSPGDTVIAAVHMPKAEEEVKPAEAEAAEGAVPAEGEGEKKEGEGEKKEGEAAKAPAEDEKAEEKGKAKGKAKGKE